jgi:hypothetical protein
MINPENWPLWEKALLYPPMLIGAVSVWLPLAKTPILRPVQIGFIAYFYLFCVFCVWGSPIGCALLAVVAFGLLVFLFLRRKNSN